MWYMPWDTLAMQVRTYFNQASWLMHSASNLPPCMSHGLGLVIFGSLACKGICGDACLFVSAYPAPARRHTLTGASALTQTCFKYVVDLCFRGRYAVAQSDRIYLLGSARLGQ
jgi:hypothetical protein